MIVKAENLVKRFHEKTVVDHVSFTLEEGKIFGLLGHNGAGKSTTIDCLLGVKKQDEGSVSIFDLDPRKNRKKIFEEVGVQLQHNFYQDKIKVYELCEEIACLYQKPNAYEELLEEFQLTDKKQQYVSSLSGGERQKLSIVLALIPNPKVLVLDELTTGLDSAARRSIWKRLLQLKEKGVSIILVSHFMDEVKILCDEIVILEKGRMVVKGSVKEVMKASPYKTLEEAYLWHLNEEVIL